MFTSLQSRTLVLITLVMAITAGAMMLATHRDVGRAMLHAEESSAQNVLQLVELVIRGGYNRLVTEKIEILSKLKKELIHTSAMGASVLEEYVVLSETGQLSKKIALGRALKWLESVDFDKGELFVFGRDAHIVAHSDTGLKGTSIAGLQDMKGRSIVSVMRDDVLRNQGDFAVFSWRSGSSPGSNKKKLGYFVPIPGWQWTLAAIVDFDDIEAESQRKMVTIVEELRDSFAKIQIATSGYVFLFNGQKEMLIPPPDRDSESHLASVQSSLLDDLMARVELGEVSINYADPYASNNDLVRAYIGYFKAFDWYVVVAVPVREIRAPAKALVTHQSIIILLIFLGSLIAAYFLVSRISRPLKFLTAYAKELPFHDFTGEDPDDYTIDDLPVKYKDEVGRLAESLVFMRAELKKNIQNAIHSVLEREAAEEANRAKSQFLAYMSHELRTPLNAMLGYAQLLQKEPGLSAKQKKGLNTIRQFGYHLLGLINGLLDLAKIESGNMGLKKRRFLLRQMLDSVVVMVRPFADEKRLAVYCEVPVDIPDSLYGDDRKLNQILINLMSNAVKFTNKGFISLEVNRTESGLRFQIEDSGIGIPAERFDDIFKPFSRLDDPDVPAEGTGLGLAVSYKLVEVMGGRLVVESCPGRGSLFWFELDVPATGVLAVTAVTADTVASDPGPVRFQESPPEVSIDLPRPVASALLDAARKGYSKGVLQQLTELEALGEDCATFAHGLRHLTERFQFEEIVALVDPLLNQHGVGDE